MMTVSSDDGASSCRATRPRCIAKPNDPGLGRDELVDEVFNPRRISSWMGRTALGPRIL